MPGNTKTALVDREGLGLFQRAVTRDLGWIFREQTVVDQGIDGHVEIADEDGRGTGRLIAVQIKSGPSHFRRVKGGWAFYYDETKRRLWLGHALPVMVVFIDLESDAIYWQRIHTSVERRTGKRYAVTVPENQTLSTAAEPWLLAASGVEQRAIERYESNLELLPPPVRRLLEDESAARLQRALVAQHLAEGRTNPSGTAQALISTRPLWMQASNAWPWRALASFCSHHDAMTESSAAWEIAAEDGGDQAGGRLAAAAANIAAVDRTRAAELLEEARRRGGAEVVVAVVEAILEVPEGDLSPWRTDTVLAAAGAKANSTVQHFLTDQALQSDDLPKAARHAERALALEPDDAAAMSKVALICARRAETAEAQAGDLARAAELLQAAVTQRRQWSGETRGLLALLARVLMIRGQFGAVLNMLLPAPLGTANADEADDPVLRRLALTAAHGSGDSELVASIEAAMTDNVEDQIARLRLGLLELPAAEAEALWTPHLARARSDYDGEAAVMATHRLAALGVDATAQLDELIRAGALPLGTDRLPRAIATFRRNTAEGLSLLRSLSTEDPAAAEQLVHALVEVGRPDEAIAASASAAQRFRSPRFLTLHALLVFQHATAERADRALQDALQAEDRPAERVELATRLADIAATAQDWARAESTLAQVVAYQTPPPDGVVWNLVRAQLNGGGETRAAATVARHQPRVRSEEEAQLWAQAMASLAWDDELAERAIELASDFADNAQLATFLLSHLVTATRGTVPENGGEYTDDDALDAIPDPPDDRPVVRGNLHRRAFELLNTLYETHGDATGMRILSTTSPEEFLAEVEPIVRRPDQTHLAGLADQISRAQVPAGMLALSIGRSYTSALVQRTAGLLVAVAVDDAEHQAEVDAATASAGRPAVVDISTLLVLSQLTDADAVSGQVGELILALPAHHDVLRAALQARTLAGSVGSLGSSAAEGSLTFYERNEEHYQFVRDRTAAVEALAHRCSIRPVGTTSVFGDNSERARAVPWLAAIEVAAQEGMPLWCDDLAVRRLARSVGVSCFSTMAMAEVLRDTRLESAHTSDEIDAVLDATAKTVGELHAEFVVDLPVSEEQLLDQAEADGWVPAAAALAIERPSWWGWQQDPVGLLMNRLYPAVREAEPAQLPNWQRAAMLGAARAQPTPAEQRQALANLALLGWELEPALDDLVGGFRTARRLATALGDIRDPLEVLPAARTVLAENGINRSDQVVQQLTARLRADAGEAAV
ncbi:DUF4365 domain-containing protein [Amycolatopsis sp. NPDC051758]|uniref:DUF4365 domain-containing protein n=1 Tax=Amycolatopsis sp. NPDC051758 TaxID=3363935 RepID=UPI0037AE4E8C